MANNTKIKKIKTKASDMLFLAVLAYLACAAVYPLIEYLIVWTPLIDTIQIGNKAWTAIAQIVSCLAWGASAYFIWRASKKCGFDPVGAINKPKAIEWTVLISGTVVFAAVFVIIDKGFAGIVANVRSGVMYLIFMAVQVAIRCLVISLAQKWGELAFPKWSGYIPYGGIVLGLLMFTVNLISGGGEITALILFAIHLYFGALFTFSGKKLWLLTPAVYLMLLMM